MYSPALQSYGSYGLYGTPSPPSPADSGSPRAKRSIQINGFPIDVKERELNNLLVFFPGYQASMMLWGSAGPEGRAAFSTYDQAHDALRKLNGLEFESGRPLKVFMAPEELDFRPRGSMRRNKSSEGSQLSPTGVISPPPPFAPPHPTAVMPFPTATVPFAAGGRVYGPVKNEKDNPPCNTLFIGNLGENVDDEELKSVFREFCSPQPGFQQLKVVRGPRGISAFIEFSDVASAIAAHDTQQGLLLNSSYRGPIRVQYSKNPFGRKRDVVPGLLVSPGGGGIAPGAPVAIQPLYAPYAVPVPQSVLPPGYIYNASPPGGAAVFPMMKPPPPAGPPLPNKK